MNPIDPTRLVQGIRLGDEEAVRHLVEAYYAPILRYLFRMLQDHQGAEDVCQEVFVRAVQRIDQLRDPKGLKTWLYRIAANLAHDHRRRPKESPVAAVPHTEALTGEFEAMRERLYVAELLQILSVEQRQVVILRFYEDLSLADIGEVLGIPIGTVKSRLHHALRRLRAHVEKDEEEVASDAVRGSRAYPSHVG